MKLHRSFFWTLIGVVSISLFSPNLRSLAQSNEEANSLNKESKIPNKSLVLEESLRAVRLSFMENTLKFVNNVAKTNVQIKWEFLPASEASNFRNLQARYDARKASIIIPNNQLGDAKQWMQSLSAVNLLKTANECPILEKALPTPINQKEYETRWQPQNKAWKQLVGPSMRATEYFSLLRDYNLVKGLLNNSRGVKFYFSIPNVVETREIDDKVNWKIDVYEFEVKSGNNCQDRVVYYRYNIEAITEPIAVAIAKNKIPQAAIDASIPSGENKQTVKLPIKIEAYLKKNPQLAGLLDDVMYLLKNDGDIAVVFDNSTQKLIEKLAEEKAATTLNATVPIVGNLGNLGQFITNSFLGGTEESSIISGGLIDFGNDKIGGLIGVNRELYPQENISPGVLFGVGVAGNTPISLYLGPSLRASPFTISAGANIIDENNSLNVNVAGVIAVDLSNLFSNKKVENTLTITSTDQGGGWYQATEVLAKDLALLETSSDTEFKLRRVCESNGNVITDQDEQAVFTVKKLQNTLQFIPRGYYVYEGIPANTELKVPLDIDGDGNTDTLGEVDTNKPFSLLEDKFYPMSWVGQKVTKSDQTVTKSGSATSPSLECLTAVQP